MISLVWRIVRFFLFRLDPERAHRLTVGMIRLSPEPLLRIACGSGRAEPARPRVFGMDFSSRVGLAAGFDKDAELLGKLPSLGFGFAEIGTVTPRPQPGNERPRLFRDPPRSSIFNRMGFNGEGARVVSERLAGSRPCLPDGFRVGVNLGKNKDTPLEGAAADYASAAACFRDLADYLVINVSSPNTPGLRSLQTLEALRPIVGGVTELIGGWTPRPALLLKLAPEVEGEDLQRLLGSCESMGIDGWVLTNTLGGRIEAGGRELQGGWSGGVLTERARRSLIQARASTRLPIISVGGILGAEEARERRALGADLVQLYTGWIYGGPAFPARLARELARAGAV